MYYSECVYVLPFVYLAEWQVMCVFKALLVNPREDHTHLSREEFYDFYEIQNLKWREVREGERG